MKSSKSKNIFLSIVGGNDSGKLTGKDDGAILTALKEFGKNKFDTVYLIYTINEDSETNFYKIAKYLSREIEKRGYCKKIKIVQMEIDSVLDYNEIYPKLLQTCIGIKKENKGFGKFTASISSGTPAMSVCWILMAESFDFNVELIQVSPPKFKKEIITKVKLGIGLPKIKRLEEEVDSLLPSVVMDVKKGLIYVNNELLPLSPSEFSYYRYFLERKISGENDLRISGIQMPSEFKDKYLKYYKESFPEDDIKIKKIDVIMVSNFRSTVSKLKTKIESTVNESHSKYLVIYTDGKRHSKTYEIKLKKEKIKIIK